MTDPVFVYIPKENVNDETVTLVEWLAPNGAMVQRDQALAVIETSKVTFDFPSPAEGVLQYRHAERAEIEVGGLLCIISADGQAQFPDAGIKPSAGAQPVQPQAVSPSASTISALSAPPPAPDIARQSPPPPAQTRFSASARALLEREKMDPLIFKERGLVRSCDILEYLGRGAAKRTASQSQAAASDSGHSPEELLKLLSRGAPFHSADLSRSKRLEIKHLGASLAQTIPSMVSATLLTRGLRAAAEAEGVNPSAVIIFETARLLRSFPQFNAFCANRQIHYYDEVNIGFAVDIDHGLKVPVIRRADEKPLREIAAELEDLLAAYINDELAVESLSGATFTITDLSGEGVFIFHPLIDLGQSAILGAGAEYFPPGSSEGMFNLMLGFDHQASEGRAAAQFLAALSERLRHYEKALSVQTPEPANLDSSGPPPPGDSHDLYCHSCERSLADLQELRAHLLQEIGPGGDTRLICSLCLRGL